MGEGVLYLFNTVTTNLKSCKNVLMYNKKLEEKKRNKPNVPNVTVLKINIGPLTLTTICGGGGFITHPLILVRIKVLMIRFLTPMLLCD